MRTLATTTFAALTVLVGFALSGSQAHATLEAGRWVQLNFTDGWIPADRNGFNVYNASNVVTNQSLTPPSAIGMIDSRGDLVPELFLTASNWSGVNWDGASNLAPWPAGDGTLTPAAAAGEGDSVWRRDEHINFWWDGGTDSNITVHGLDPSLRYNVYYYSKHSSPGGIGTGEFHTLTVNGNVQTTEPRGTRFADPDEDLFFPKVELNASDHLAMVWGTAPGSGYNPVVSAILIQAVPTNNLLLQVQSNGLVSLVPPSSGSLEIKGYSVSSAEGDLTPGSWTGLESIVPSLGNGNATDGLGWEKLGAGLATKVGEYNLTGTTVFGSGGIDEAQSLGSLFAPGGAENLKFQIVLANGSVVDADVSYVTSVDVAGDYNGNGIVDAADYVVWRDSNGATGAGLAADGDGNNAVNDDDRVFWRDRFGGTSGSGSGEGANLAAVPEPTALLMCITVACGLLLPRSNRSRAMRLVCGLACLGFLLPGTAEALVTLDRDFRLGDNSAEGALNAQPVGSGNQLGLTYDSKGSPGAGDLQDLAPAGTVTYTNSVTSRPVVGDSGLGVLFAGGYLYGDFNTGTGGLGYPGAMPSPNLNPSIDYSGITTRGIQMWVNPTNNAGVRQEIINDTYQFGIHIAADNTWAMTWGAASATATAGRVIGSTSPVEFNDWSHVHQHSYGNTRGVLYVDGVAVATSAPNQIYQTAGVGSRNIAVGATIDTFENPFSGTMDDIEIYVAGVSTNTSTDWGTFDLETDNDYIASLGLSAGDLTNNDIVDDADVDIFIDNWRSEQLLSGIRTGDLNSRMLGDFDYDGFVGLLDWHILRTNHVDGASLNLGALLAAAAVPEPTSIGLVGLGLAAIAFYRRGLRRLKVATCLLAYGSMVLAISSNVHAAGLWNVDFQGDTTSGGFNGQTDELKLFGPDPESGIWNHFTIPALSANPQVNFAVDPSLSLVDDEGTAGPVTVTLEGNYAGWNGGAGAHPLFGDYVILLGDGILGFPAPPLNLSITGLTPGANYGLRVISGNVSLARDLLVTVDNDGNGSLANDASVVAPSGGVGTDFSFTASATGELIGTMDLNTAVEANLAGLQIKLGDFLPTLTIDRESGQMTFQNGTSSTLNMTAYLIESNDAGALNPAQWQSITDNYDASSGSPTVDPNSDWLEFTMAAERDNLSEAQDVSGTGAAFVTGQSIDLGEAWIRSPLEDVTMQVLLADGSVEDVKVQYEGLAPVVGDLDFDRDVDLTDWALMKTGFSTDLASFSAAERYGKGDFSLDGVIDLIDVSRFGEAFDTFQGEGAFAALGGNQVPEPTTTILLLIGLCVAGRWYVVKR